MLHDTITALNRSRATIWQDIFGAVALIVLLIGALALPAML